MNQHPKIQLQLHGPSMHDLRLGLNLLLKNGEGVVCSLERNTLLRLIGHILAALRCCHHEFQWPQKDTVRWKTWPSVICARRFQFLLHSTHDAANGPMFSCEQPRACHLDKCASIMSIMLARHPRFLHAMCLDTLHSCAQ